MQRGELLKANNKKMDINLLQLKNFVTYEKIILLLLSICAQLL